MDNVSKFVCLAGLALAIGGCAVGPNYVRPAAPPASDEWMEAGVPQVTVDSPNYKEWWTTFGDPVLDSLIEMARAQNLSLRAAGVRVLEARARRLVAVGSFFPQSQQATAEYARTLRSRNLYPSSEIDTAALDGVARTFNFWTGGFDAAWELDFWGKFRRAIESSTAALDAAVYDYDDVLITLVAEVAAAYVQVRAFEERLQVARDNVGLQEETLELTKKRFEYGTVTELDVEQAKANLSNTQAFIPGLETGLRQTRNALCILLGMPPRDLGTLLGGPGAIPAAPAEVAVGIPAELLRRRPDVRRAEREVAAETARIGVAAADLYPHIILKGSIGVEADDFSDLFESASLAGAVGPSVRWDILNYGRIVNRARAQNARAEEAAVNYRDTVLKAYGEAEDAITAYLQAQEKAAFLGESVEAARRSVNLSLLQYREGTADFTRVLNSETFLAEQQDSLIVTRRDIARNLIALHKALGGGREIRRGDHFIPEETEEEIRSRFGWMRGWWPRLSLGWPFTGRPQAETATGAYPDIIGGEPADEDTGDEEKTGDPDTVTRVENLVFQRVPVRVSRTSAGMRESLLEEYAKRKPQMDADEHR